MELAILAVAAVSPPGSEAIAINAKSASAPATVLARAQNEMLRGPLGSAGDTRSNDLFA